MNELVAEIEEMCGNNEEEVIKTGHFKLLEIIKKLHPHAIES